MSGRRRSTLSPTLFPFLAVLVCTLGTLILFLALVAQQAQDSAEAETTATNDSETAQQVGSLVTEAQWMRDRYVALRQQQTDDLKDRSLELTHMESQIRKLRDELQQLSSLVELTAQEQPELSRQKAELKELRQRLQTEKAELEKWDTELTSRKPRVVIVPHKGPNGTDQRPIYVECNAQGVRLQPEGSFISVEQLNGPAIIGNPLDAALRAVRHHWRKTDPDGPDAYPLLVVRPDGIETYALARTAMRHWDDQFGYELIPADVDLAFPKSSATLKTSIDIAIRDAVERQQQEMAALASIRRQQLGGRGRPRAFTASELARNSAAIASGSAARGSLSGSHSTNRGASNPSQTQGRTSATDPPTGQRGMDSREIRDLDAGLKRAANAAGNGGQGGSGELAWGSETDPAIQQWLAGQPSGTPPSGGRSGSEQSTINADAESNRPQPTTHDFADGNPTGSPGDPGKGASGESLMQDNREPANSATGDTATSVGTAGTTNTATTGNAPAGPQQQPGGTAGQPMNMASGGNPGSFSGSSPAAATASPPTGAGMTAQLSADQQSPSARETPTDTTRTLTRGGNNWALPATAQPRGTAIVRGMSVVVTPDAFLLLPDSGRGPTQTFRIRDGLVRNAAMQLATAAHDRIDAWGYAIRGGHWQPVLRVQVQPQAEQRFDQLQTLLQGSGLEIERR